MNIQFVLNYVFLKEFKAVKSNDFNGFGLIIIT